MISIFAEYNLFDCVVIILQQRVHVDISIKDPFTFCSDQMLMVTHPPPLSLLQQAKKFNCMAITRENVSTINLKRDEVYGNLCNSTCTFFTEAVHHL